MDVQTILIVDDDAEIREGLRILLGGESYMILEAANGQQALEQMTDTVDLVILDMTATSTSRLPDRGARFGMLQL